MAVIAIAGLPGSGKTVLIKDLVQHGYSSFDDINTDWCGRLPRARTEARTGRDLVVSDIMFCDESWRKRLETELGIAVQWIFFENNPWQCAKNSLFRFMFEKPDRPLQNEIRKIQELSRIYKPHGDIRPVADAGASYTN